MSRLKNPDPITADNQVTSEGALRLLGLLPDDYDLKSSKEKQLLKENRIRILKFWHEKFELRRIKINGRSFNYLKTQLERLREKSIEEGFSLTSIN